MSELDQGFRSFLIEAKQHGYSSEDARPVTNLGGDRELLYTAGTYQYRDNWIGGTPYIGYEYVAHAETDKFKPVWGMSYRGITKHLSDVGVVNKWLKRALPNPDPAMPIRGPLDGIVDETGGYNLEVDGELDDFEAEERIYDDGRLVYVARFLGGIADL